MNKEMPLVSIMIPNYNYGHYLKQCLDSVYSQTYSNIEVILLDNCSQDNSLEIAKAYLKYGLNVCKNVYNVHTDSYKIMANSLVKGKYMMLLPSDDYILPEFVERCVEVFEKYPNVGYVHVERDFVDEKNVIQNEEPFYKCSFVAPGEEVMPIYMMTTVAHPAQAMYRRTVFEQVGGFTKFVEHTNADKCLWFFLSTVSDYAYIREKLARVRRGQYTETYISQVNFQHPLLLMLTLMDFEEYARHNGYSKVSARADISKKKLSVEMLEYCSNMIYIEEYETAEKYLILCEILDREIILNNVYVQLKKMIYDKKKDETVLKRMFSREGKHRNYNPPDNYMSL